MRVFTYLAVYNYNKLLSYCYKTVIVLLLVDISTYIGTTKMRYKL